MTPRCYHMHESHIQAHELRVSGELEFGSIDPDSPMHIHTTIRNHSLHGLEFISFLGIYPGILILLTINQYKHESRGDKSGVACTRLPINMRHSLQSSKGFVLRKERAGQAGKRQGSAEHRSQRTVDLND